MTSFEDMVQARGPVIKSDLQTKLESEGWEFLDNDLLSSPFDFKEPIKVLSDEEIRAKYLERGYTDVLVAEAYNSKGKRIKTIRIFDGCLPVKLKAVYVKGESRPI